MDKQGLTTIELKKINKGKVYHYIYKERLTSKMRIVTDLQMGLSTVSQNLAILEQEGLIERNGFFDSTGGRKAHAIRIVPDVRISIGIGILKDRIHLASVDLYGKAVCMDTVSLSYSNTESYYRKAAESIERFIDGQHYKKEKILGVSIAAQGIISPDGSSVTYGAIMGNTDMKLTDFSARLPYPCRLEHDSKAAAYLEHWNHETLDSAIVLLLNQNLGGAIITNHQVHQGLTMHSGTVEHICVNPDGALCYCGNHGCLETCCSANALEAAAGMPAGEFFPLLREGKNPELSQIWDTYLKYLAFAMRNLNIVIDSPIIISGYLAPYLIEKDIDFLIKEINQSAPFAFKKEHITVGTHGQYTPAVGAALFYIDHFIQSV